MRDYRLAKKLSPIEVGKQIGVVESTVRNWEQGRTVPRLRLSQFMKLTEIYDCTLEELQQAIEKSSKEGEI
jgi:transcriptional regulator with XRE-family HTH domain